MDLTINDSKTVRRVVSEVLNKYIDEKDFPMIFNTLVLDNEGTNELLHTLNNMLIKSDYALKIKEIISDLSDSFATRLDVRLNNGDVKLFGGSSQDVVVEVTNKFDVPLVFEVKLEDRDTFLPIIYNKVEDDYFNSVSEEKIIDTEDTGKFRFRIGSAKTQKRENTVLFALVKSKDIEGLNVINKIRVEIN